MVPVSETVIVGDLLFTVNIHRDISVATADCGIRAISGQLTKNTILGFDENSGETLDKNVNTVSEKCRKPASLRAGGGLFHLQSGELVTNNFRRLNTKFF